MPEINPESRSAIQPELLAGENILWAGQPNTGVIFRKDDLWLIPFSLMWGGFAIFWMAGASGFWPPSHHSGRPWLFAVIWGTPFVLMGQYMIWGRFFYAAWKKRRTHYAVTDRRVVVVQNAWKRQVASADVDGLLSITTVEGRNGVGTLRFAPSGPLWSRRGGLGAWTVMEVGIYPTFMDIDDVQSVYRLVSDLRERAPAPKASH
jgi:hypothetical protein